MEYRIQKNNEASYFSKKLIEFTYNLSAFLTSTRSRTAYIRDNAKKKIDFENLTKIDNKANFLKDQRNITVHIRKVEINTVVNVDINTEINGAF